MSYSTTKPPGADGQYTPAEREAFAAIRADLKRDGLKRRETPDIATAAQIAPLLRSARAYLATFRPRVCPVCAHVFSPAGRSDPRCLDCAPHPQLARGIAPLPGVD